MLKKIKLDYDLSVFLPPNADYSVHKGTCLSHQVYELLPAPPDAVRVELEPAQTIKGFAEITGASGNGSNVTSTVDVLVQVPKVACTENVAVPLAVEEALTVGFETLALLKVTSAQLEIHVQLKLDPAGAVGAPPI